MMRILSIATVIILLGSSTFAVAEMYRWVEEDGSIVFKDTPPPKPTKSRKVKAYSDGDFAPSPPVQPAPSTPRSSSYADPAPRPATAKQVRFNGTVEIYVTDWCGYCKKAISYLRERGIPFNAHDIEKDPAARQRHKELGGRGVPLIIIGANRMSGFSAEVLERYLNGGN
jgi:glutaredoxin-like YruB-family protein